MKLAIIVTALAMSSAVFAQTSAKDSIAAFKAAQKEAKALKAAQLKAFKQKQKYDLAAFIKAQEQGAGAEYVLPAVEMKNAGDSLAHIYGIAQSSGLMNYMISQLGVDTAYISNFCEGVMDRAKADPKDKAQFAYTAGGQIGGQILNMATKFSQDYYSADPDMTIDPSIVAHGLLEGLLGKNTIPVSEASQEFKKKIEELDRDSKEDDENIRKYVQEIVPTYAPGTNG